MSTEPKKQAQKIVRMPLPKRKKQALQIAATLLLVFICLYQVFKINYQPVDTEIAFRTTVSKAVTTDVFIVRDETYIEAGATGTLVPLVADGKRVASGDEVAVVFGDEASARVYSQMENLRAEIAYFESLKNKIGIQTSDIETLDNRVYTACEALVCAADDTDLDAMQGYTEGVCEAITSRQLSTGTMLDPAPKLGELYSQLDALDGQPMDYVTVEADNPGYYIAHVDGYEQLQAYDSILDLTTPEIQALLQAPPVPTEQLKTCMGKLVDSFNWYMLCVIDADSAADLETGRHIRVEFPQTSAPDIQAEIVRVENAGNGQYGLILRSNLMNAQYASLRKEKARLVLDEVTGFRINNRAVREVDGVQGVYTVSGNLVKFKKVNLEYTESEYSICVTPKNEDGHELKGYVTQYDEIIIEGTDLYDGKILD